MRKLTDLRDDNTCPHSHATALVTFQMVNDSLYFLPDRFTNVNNFCH